MFLKLSTFGNARQPRARRRIPRDSSQTALATLIFRANKEDRMERRPIKFRRSRAAAYLAHKLASLGVTPNQISTLSVTFALVGGVMLGLWPQSAVALVSIGALIQLRLLCNLLDGMVAIEGGKADCVGPFFNEVPDRLADVLLLVPLGYAVGEEWLGWLIACLALSAAYLRAFGAALGFGNDFRGPGAKPQRMAILTCTCLLAALESRWTGPLFSFWAGAIALCALTTLTIVRRSLRITECLHARAAGEAEGTGAVQRTSTE